MSPSARPIPDALVGRAFSLAEARAAGCSVLDLERAALRRPTRGVRTTESAPAPDDLAARCRELLPVLPRTAVFSHATALHLLGVDRPRGLRRPDDVHVEVPHTVRRPRRHGVASHSRLTEHQEPVLVRHGLPVALPARAWTQLAGELGGTELVVLGDALLRRRRPHATLRDLERAVDRLLPGARGARRLRDALPHLRTGTDSCQETRLRVALVAAGLPCPVVNHPVHDRDGRFVALPDLSYREARVAVEYDGDVHRTERRTWRRDVARRQALEHAGWRLITCTADDVRDPTRAIRWIRAALADQDRRVSRT